MKSVAESLVDALEAAVKSGQGVEQARRDLLAWMDGVHKAKDALQRMLWRRERDLADAERKLEEA